MTSFPTTDQTAYAARTTDLVTGFAKNVRWVILNCLHNIDEVRIIIGSLFISLLIYSFNHHAALKSISPSSLHSKEILACYEGYI